MITKLIIKTKNTRYSLGDYLNKSGEKLFKELYMGFGYSPDVARFGERIEILDFFSWLKSLIEASLSANWLTSAK